MDKEKFMIKYLKSVFYVGIAAYVIKSLTVIAEILAFSDLGDQMGFPIYPEDLNLSDWYNSVLQFNQFFYLFTFIFMFSLVMIFAIEKKHDTFSNLLIFAALANGILFYGFFRNFDFVNGNVSTSIVNFIFIAFFYSLYRISSGNKALLPILVLRSILLFVSPFYETNPILVDIVILASSVLTVMGLYKISKTGDQIFESHTSESVLEKEIEATN